MRERNRSSRGKKRPATTEKAAELNAEESATTETQPVEKKEEPSPGEAQATPKEKPPVSADQGEEKAEKAPSPAGGPPAAGKTPPPPPPVAEKGGGGGCAAVSLSLLAILLSLGVGGAGYYGWQQLQAERQQTTQNIQQVVDSQMGQVGSTLQENQQKLTGLEKEIAALKSEIGVLEKKQEELRTLQHDTTLQEMAALNEKLTAIASDLEQAQQRLAELQSQQEKISSRVEEANAVLEKLASVDEAIAALNQQIETASARQKELLSTLEAAREQAERELDSWKLVEAEYLLKMASRRLSLEHDIDGAVAALKAADENLAETDDPRWTPVRRAIAEAVEQLGALPKPDIEGGALTLAALEKKVEELPLPQPERHLQSTALDTSELKQAKDLETWGDKVWNAVSKLVVIRRGDKPATQALLPPDQALYLRQNLLLKLESARYALLRGEAKLFKENLKIAREWIESHFDTGAETTRAVLESLEKLQKMAFPQTLPDITPPLRQLRELKSRKSPAAAVEANPPQPAPEPASSPDSSDETAASAPQEGEGEEQPATTPSDGDTETEGGSS